MDRLAAVLIAAALALGGVACGERSEPTGAALDPYPLTIAGGGDRPLVVRHPVRRLAALSPAPGNIVVALGAADRLVGTPVKPSGRVAIRELRRLRPDLIAASAGTDEIELSRAAQAVHVPVYVAPGESIREVERAITQLGLIVDKPVAARRLVRGIESVRRRVAARLDGKPRPTVFVDTGLFTTVSDQSLAGDLIREARGRNVAGSSPTAEPFDLRELARVDPDIYLITSDSGTSLAELRRNRRTRALKAVRTGRVATIDSSLLEPGPDIGTGLLEIARILHPDAFR
jgi:ABC-type Fe3+-hydroxamate transport system substrate-binding protein